MKNDLIVLVYIVIFISVLFVVLFGLGWAANSLVEYNKCQTYKTIHLEQFEFQWTFWAGCLLKTKSGRWIYVDDYYLIEKATK